MQILSSLFTPYTFTLLLGSLILVFYHFYSKRFNRTEANRVLDHILISTIIFGALVLILIDDLPSTPVLKSFGYPETVSNIHNNEKVLYYLQEYNKAIVQTAEVASRFLFLFIWWLTTLIAVAIRAFRLSR